MARKTCIVISGPTAAGKTALSLRLAEYFNTEIISADSRQCYRDLNIGVAKPDPADLQRIKHYFINSHSIHEDVNAGIFESYALQAVSAIFEKHDIAFLVGGTGLYIQAFCKGLDNITQVKPSIREEIRQQYAVNGLPWLKAMVEKHDPLFFAKGEMQNPQRMMRALEVRISSGKSILEFHSPATKQRDFSIIQTGIELPRKEIYERINHRVDEMMEKGLLTEVETLFPFRHLNALQTVGYTELFTFLEGKCTIEKAVTDIKKNTRHYAKRQITWFKRDPNIQWFAPAEADRLIHLIKKVTE